MCLGQTEPIAEVEPLYRAALLDVMDPSWALVLRGFKEVHCKNALTSSAVLINAGLAPTAKLAVDRSLARIPCDTLHHGNCNNGNDEAAVEHVHDEAVGIRQDRGEKLVVDDCGCCATSSRST